MKITVSLQALASGAAFGLAGLMWAVPASASGELTVYCSVQEE